MNKPIIDRQRQDSRQEQPKPAGLMVCPEAVDLLREVFRHSNPHPSVAYRSSLVAELIDKLRVLLRDRHGMEFDVE